MTSRDPLLKSDEEEDLLFEQNGHLAKRHSTKPDVILVGHSRGIKLQVARTINLCLSFFGLGLCFAIPTATLEDLRRSVQSDKDSIEYIYTARYGGYLVGSIAGGILFDRYNRQFLLFLSLLATAVGIVVMPFCAKLAALMTCTAITGITMGFLDTGGNVWCLDLWGKKSAPIMQALHFCFGLGAFIAPLVAEPFLSPHVTHSAVSVSENGSNITNSRLNMASLNFAHGPVSGRNNVRHLLGISLGEQVELRAPVFRIQPDQNYTDLSAFHNLIRIKNLVSPYNQNLGSPFITQKKPEIYSLQKRDTDVNATSMKHNSTTKVNGLNESITIERNGEQFNIKDYEDSAISNVSKTKDSEISNNTFKENNETILLSSGKEETVTTSSQSLHKPKPSVTGAKVPVDESPWNRKRLKSPNFPEKSMSNEKRTEDVLNGEANNATEFSEAIHATDVTIVNETENKVMRPRDEESGSENDRTIIVGSSAESLYQELTTTIPSSISKASDLQLTLENVTHFPDLVKATSEESEGTSFPIEKENIKHYINKLQKASGNITNPDTGHDQISAITTKPPKNDFNSNKYKLTNVSSEEVTGEDTSLIRDVLDVGSTVKQLQTMNKSGSMENLLPQTPKNDVLAESLETSSISKTLNSEVERTSTGSVVSETSMETTKDKVDVTLPAALEVEHTSAGSVVSETSREKTKEKFSVGLSPVLDDGISSPELGSSEGQKSNMENTSNSVLVYNTSNTKDEHKGDIISYLFKLMHKNRLGKFEFAYAILSIYVLIVAVVFLVFLCLNPREPRSRQEEELDKSHHVSKVFIISVVGLLSVFLCLYVGIQVAVGQLLQRFAIKEELQLSKYRGSFLTYLYWGSFALARGVSIGIAARVKTLHMLFGDLIVCLVASVLLVAGANKLEALLWVGIVVLGLGMASVLPAAISWVERYIHVTNKMAATFILGAALGEMVIPLGINRFISEEPMVLMYVNVVVIGLCFLTFLILWFLASRAGEKYRCIPSKIGYQLASAEEADDTMEMSPTNSHWQNSYNSRILFKRNKGFMTLPKYESF
ncbi:uncharacterized protein LOC106468196 isoform X2 [Limulus polyphemus]|nr:uncharacterized protein LOC106468196 isoform X2 [Limulus polyphemus]